METAITLVDYYPFDQSNKPPLSYKICNLSSLIDKLLKAVLKKT